MMEPVKVMMDEQTKLALKQLEGALSELLAPLKNRGTGDSSANLDAAVQLIICEIRKLSNLVEDAVDDIKRKMTDVCDNQAELFRKLAELSARQAAVQAAPQAEEKKVPAVAVAMAPSKRPEPKKPSKPEVPAKKAVAAKAVAAKKPVTKKPASKVAVKKRAIAKAVVKRSRKIR